MIDQVGYSERRLGNYRLLQLLGKGGFADVYLGEHVHIKTQAAIKQLHTHLTEKDIERFRHEARTIARLLHPNIVRILDFDVEENIPYLVMDYAPNGTLRQRYPDATQVPLSTIVHLVKQVAEGLQYAHDQGIIHRDIKPENMLVGRKGEILLSDFGIALTTQSTTQQHVANIAGTVAYMAPEQMQAHPLPASDQYSLAVVVYEWLTGTRPFQGSFSEVAVKQVLATPPSLQLSLPWLSKDIELVLMKALSKDVQQRFESIQAFALAFEKASSQKGVTASPVPSTLSSESKSLRAINLRALSQPGLFPQQRVPTSPHMTVQAPPSFPGLNGLPAVPSDLSSSSKPKTDKNAIPEHRRFLPISRREFVAGAMTVAAVGTLSWYALPRVMSSAQSNTKPVVHIPGLLFTINQHADAVITVNWSPDGRYLASGSRDTTAQVWSATTGEHIFTYTNVIKKNNSPNWPRGVTWSPTGKFLAVGYISGTVQILEFATRKRVRVFDLSPAEVGPAVWSPDGNYIAAGCDNNKVYVYDVMQGKLVTTFSNHEGLIMSLAWSHDGERVASSSVDFTARVWNPFTGKELAGYDKHTNSVESVDWSPDDRSIVSASTDQTVRIWNSQTGTTLSTLVKDEVSQVHSAVWSHNGLYIVSGGDSAQTFMWEAKSGRILRKYDTSPVQKLAWSPDDTRIVVGCFNRTLQVWSLK